MNAEYDPAFAEAVTRELKHQQPFSTAELEGLTELHVRNARSLSGIASCASLEILILVGCDPVDLGALAGLSGLRSLTISDSGLHSLVGVADLSLRRLTVPRNFINDASELLACRRLQSADLTGNPLSDASFHDVIPELAKKLRRVRHSGELAWRVTTHLHRNDVPVCCYQDDRGYRLSRPGLRLTPSPEFAHPVITEEAARALLRDPQRAYAHFDREDFLTPRAEPD